MNRIDYNAAFETIVGGLCGRPRLLLHVCCAPCLCAAIERLYEKFDVTLYYYNPNIFPEAEYEKRLTEVKKLIAGLGLRCEIAAEPYDRRRYDEAVGALKGTAERGAKCALCCSERLARTAKKAREGGYEYFCTTLTSSPLKDAGELNREMSAAAAEYGVRYLPSDFKKKGGSVRIKELCSEFGIYRQRYCGCTPPRFVAAVTGGIASGKSVFTGMLAALGAYTIDADQVTKELQAEGQAVCEAIKRAFPAAVRNGRLDRAALKSEVFSAPDRLRLLESIVHPAVGKELRRRIDAADAGIVVVEIPLLFECGLEGLADETVNVTAPKELREKRALARDGMSAKMFDDVSSAQMSDEERERRADVTVVNDGDEKALEERAKELMRKWLDRLK